MKNTVSKMIREIMVILMIVTTVSMAAVPVNAKKKTVLIKDFTAKTSLNYDQYNALRTGEMDVIKEDDQFYYTFESEKIIVKVPVNTFAKDNAGNDYSSVNKKLSDYVLKQTGDSKKFSYIYKKSSVSKGSKEKGSVYSTYICNLRLDCGIDTNATTYIMCEMKGQILFTYNTKVKNAYFDSNALYVKPSRDTEYLRALHRNSSDSLGITLSPQFELDITEPGDDEVYLERYRVYGKGRNEDESKRGRATIKTMKSIIAASESIIEMSVNPKASTALGIIDTVVDIDVDNGGEYNTGMRNRISSADERLKAFAFKAPLPLGTYKDFVGFDIQLSHAPTPSGKKRKATKVSVKFSII